MNDPTDVSSQNGAGRHTLDECAPTRNRKVVGSNPTSGSNRRSKRCNARLAFPGQRLCRSAADQGEAVGPCVGEQDPPGRRLGCLRLVFLRSPVREPGGGLGRTGLVQGQAAGIGVRGGVHEAAMLATSQAAQPGHRRARPRSVPRRRIQ